MPTFNHSKFTYLQFDNASDALQNISTYLTSVELPEELELIDVTTMGTTSKQFEVGYADAKLSFQGYWDPTLDGILTGVKQAQRNGTLIGAAKTASFVYGKAGNTAGYVKYLGEAFITSYKKSNEIKGVTEFMVECQISGPVTVTTF